MLNTSWPDVSLPLSGVRMVDFTDGPAGFAGRFLADLGADVVLVEPPEGANSRRAQPQHDGHGLAFATAHANKRGQPSTSTPTRDAPNC